MWGSSKRTDRHLETYISEDLKIYFFFKKNVPFEDTKKDTKRTNLLSAACKRSFFGSLVLTPEEDDATRDISLRSTIHSF